MDNFTSVLFINAVFFITLLISQNFILSSIIVLFILFILLKSVKIQQEVYKLEYKLPRIVLRDRHYITSIISAIAIIILEPFISFYAAIFVGFCLFCRYNKLSNKAPFFVALFLLFLTAVFSLTNDFEASESIATLAYYFLVIGLIWQIYNLRACPDKSHLNKKPL